MTQNQVPFGLMPVLDAALELPRTVLPLKSVRYHFIARGGLAEVEMTQVYRQENAQPLDCEYLFPLPADGAVYRCEAVINGRVIRARIEEKEAARKIVKEKKAEGRRTALVESERDNLFTLSLGNVQPQDVVEVTLAYLQPLRRQDQQVSLDLPLCPGVRYIPGRGLLRSNRGTGIVDDTDQVSDASRITPPRIEGEHPDAAFIELDGQMDAGFLDGEVTSPSHKLNANRQDGLLQLTLAQGGEVPDRDLALRWQERKPAQTAWRGWTSQQDGHHYALIELRAPASIESADPVPQDVYFLVDRSGSMQGQKWQKAVEALQCCVLALNPTDRVWVTLFESTFQDFGSEPDSPAALMADSRFRGLAALGTAGGTEFPLWSVSNLSARSAIPLIPALYDLVIIDEASQCDIASVIPLLARSRQAVFAGDPMQLRHVSNLDVAVEQTLLTQHGLTDSQLQRFTYRVNSAFEFADSTASIPVHARVRLDLHFRSHSLIANYCNEAFYSNTLSVVTLTERLNIPAGMQPGIHWTQVTGKIEAGTTGSWCADEIERVCQELNALAKAGYRGTVGVVTPFRQQMIRLRDALDSSDSIPRDFMDRVHFLASTAHGFQGDERDLILFSLCGGPDMPDGSTIFLRENPNLFNVAVSRARAVLHVIGNRDWALNSGVSFIEKLARRTIPGAQPDRDPSREPYQSPWEKTLALALADAGIKAIPQYPVAARFLDLAVLGSVKLDIEVDGESVHRTAGGGRKDDDHWRDLQLQSLGWQVCRFWVYELREDLPRCIKRIEKLLKP